MHARSRRPLHLRVLSRASRYLGLPPDLVPRALWRWSRFRGQTSAQRQGSMQPGSRQLLVSSLCNQEQLESETFRTWCTRMGIAPTMHRKQWEHCYIAQALSERGLLRAGVRGLGFAVGREPLPSLFAAFGCEVVASDWHEDAASAAGWVDTDQHASNLEVLNERGLCAPDLFRKRVSFRVVDMNEIPGDLRDFDFLWSSCSLEHLGSIEKGEQFIYNALECLRPGGVAVHTTEFNLSSNYYTVDHAPTVLFRRCDIERVAARLAAMGHQIELDFSEGEGISNHFVDVPPYKLDPHLRLLISDYVCTSIGLIIRKAPSTSALQVP